MTGRGCLYAIGAGLACWTVLAAAAYVIWRLIEAVR